MLKKCTIDIVNIDICIFQFKNLKFYEIQISPADPAVKPTIKKKQNSKRSLGRELTIKFN
mgnify:CR=1 FL=1